QRLNTSRINTVPPVHKIKPDSSATGMIVTVAAFPLLAVLLRAKLVGALARTAGWRYRIGRGLETGAALAVIAFGTILFLQR
ncbi:MAG: hypothetical protein O3B08_11460, partial [Proteobacteria bacterium]|nr:hypothetical protein [Pseudomonadota bacterium]